MKGRWWCWGKRESRLSSGEDPWLWEHDCWRIDQQISCRGQTLPLVSWRISLRAFIPYSTITRCTIWHLQTPLSYAASNPAGNWSNRPQRHNQDDLAWACTRSKEGRSSSIRHRSSIWKAWLNSVLGSFKSPQRCVLCFPYRLLHNRLKVWRFVTQ